MKRQLLIVFSFLFILSCGGGGGGGDTTPDTTAPAIVISSQAGSTTANYPIPVTFTFSENVSGFTSADITVANAAVNDFTSISGTTYRANLYPSSDPATVTVNVASDSAQDNAGNNNSAADEFSVTYNGEDLTLTITSTETSPTNNSSIPVTITFSEAVTGFTADNISVSNGTKGTLNTTDNTVFTLTVTPTGDATVTVDVNANVATDTLTGFKNNTAAPQFSIVSDRSAPGVNDVIVSGTPSNGYTTNTSVTLDIDETGLSQYRYKLDGAGSWTSAIDIAADINVSGNGLHNLQIIVRDEAGNWQDEESPKRVSFMIGTPDGTESNPYLVRTLTDLQNVRNNLTAHYVLLNDIDASATSSWDDGDGGDAEGFVPIGDNTTPFSGVFDGNNYAVSGLYINRGSADYQGLFGKVDSSVLITKVKVLNVDIDITGHRYTGGLVGYNDGGTITYCSTTGTVKTDNYFAGGLAGYLANSGNVENCYSSVSITGYCGIGGLIGRADSSTIIKSYATGIVTITTSEPGGGLIGWTVSSSVSQCYATGNVSSTNSINSVCCVGGLIGNGYYSNIDDCYARGNATGKQHVGGLLGYLNGSTVSNCFSTGIITNTGTGLYTGGFIGRVISGYTLTGNYWDTTTSLYTDGVGDIDPDPSGITGYPTEVSGDDNDMTDQGVYSGWDFTNIWAIDSTGVINGGYPYLRNNPPE